MYSWFYKGSDLVALPLLALPIFIAVFLGVLVRTYGRGSSERLGGIDALPLADDTGPAPATSTEFTTDLASGDRHE